MPPPKLKCDPIASDVLEVGSADDSGAWVRPYRWSTKHVLRSLGYETAQAHCGMKLAAAAKTTLRYPGDKFYFSLGCHAVIGMDGRIYDNGHPEGIAGDEYPQARELVVQRVVCFG